MSTVISLTTIPSRIANLERCVKSLVAQGPPVYVWLPRYVERIDAGFDEVPGFLRELDVHVEIVEDRGSATKLLPALERFDTVLTADDDHVYGEGWAAGLLAWAKKRPRAALGYRGRRFGPNLRYNKSRVIKGPKKPKRVDLITGVWGALYRRELFSDSIFEEWQECPRTDDIIFSGHLWRRGVSMLVIPKRCSIRRMDAHKIDPLYAENVHGKRLNDEGLRKCYRGWQR